MLVRLTNRRRPPLSTPHVDDRALADRLHSAAIHLLRRARRVDEETGLTPARLSALSVLVFGGPCTMGELAQEEQVRPPTMTALVRGLEGEGYVTTRRSSQDRRSVVVRGTRKARRVLERARARRCEAILEVLDHASPAERKALDRAVGVLERSLRTAGSE